MRVILSFLSSLLTFKKKLKSQLNIMNFCASTKCFYLMMIGIKKNFVVMNKKLIISSPENNKKYFCSPISILRRSKRKIQIVGSTPFIGKIDD